MSGDEADLARADLHRRYLAATTDTDKGAIWQEILLNDRRQEKVPVAAGVASWDQRVPSDPETLPESRPLVDILASALVEGNIVDWRGQRQANYVKTISRAILDALASRGYTIASRGGLPGGSND